MNKAVVHLLVSRMYREVLFAYCVLCVLVLRVELEDMILILRLILILWYNFLRINIRSASYEYKNGFIVLVVVRVFIEKHRNKIFLPRRSPVSAKDVNIMNNRMNHCAGLHWHKYDMKFIFCLFKSNV